MQVSKFGAFIYNGSMDKTFKQVVLVVLDGWGYREETKDNAIAAAKKPNFDRLWNSYPHSLLNASGLAVGLPEGQMGNSEVGHTTIGAGKEIDTDLVRISKAARNGEFEKNPVLRNLFEHVKSNGSDLHLMGLVSDGGVHSHMDHLISLLEAAKNAGVKNVLVHAFTDGRDTPPQSAAKYLKKLEGAMADIGLGRIATVIGRYYAMDRDKNWDRLELATKAIFDGEAEMRARDAASSFVEKLYAAGALDEHLKSIIIIDANGGSSKLGRGDGVLFFNFRADRARMLSEKLVEKSNSEGIFFATMTEYDSTFRCPVAFPPMKIETTLAAEVSEAGFSQVHIAETEKFAHATYFLNGGREETYPGETHELIPSRKDIATHDQAPEMRAKEIGDAVVVAIEKGTSFVFANFANADMVGHTANVPAIIKAIEAVDSAIGKVAEAAERAGAAMLITADHGNAEINVDPTTGEKHTAHTTDPVPAILTVHGAKMRDGGLADVAPTVLKLLGLQIPDAMTGKPLI